MIDIWELLLALGPRLADCWNERKGRVSAMKRDMANNQAEPKESQCIYCSVFLDQGHGLCRYCSVYRRGIQFIADSGLQTRLISVGEFQAINDLVLREVIRQYRRIGLEWERIESILIAQVQDHIQNLAEADRGRQAGRAR